MVNPIGFLGQILSAFLNVVPCSLLCVADGPTFLCDAALHFVFLSHPFIYIFIQQPSQAALSLSSSSLLWFSPAITHPRTTFDFSVLVLEAILR